MTVLDLIEPIAEDTAVGVCLTDAQISHPGPVILYVNAAFGRLVGRETAALLGNSPRFMQGPQTLRSGLDQFRAALVAGERFHGFLTNYRGDGTRYRAEIDCRPLRNKQGQVEHFVSFEREVVRRMGRPARGKTGRYEPASVSNELLPTVLKALGAFSLDGVHQRTL